MADQNSYEEQSAMDAYFNDDAFDIPIQQDNGSSKPVSHAVKNRVPSGKRSRQAALGRKILAALCALTVVGLVGGIAIYINVSRNDGAKHADKLSMSIGASVNDAQKNAKIELVSASEYQVLNQMLYPIGGVYESTKSTEVQGVTLPEWIIHCNVDEGVLGEIVYYNYELLEKNAYGTERKTYLEPASLTAGCTVEQAESLLGLTPYAVTYHTDRTETREYRYCYEDGETDDLTAYIITTTWSAEGGMISASDVRVDFLSEILGMGQPAAE